MRRIRFAAALAGAAACLVPAVAAAQASPAEGREDVLNFREDDPAMNAAIVRGRATVSTFFDHWAAQAPGEDSFHLKFDLIPGPAAEFIWAEVIAREGSKTRALLLNEPIDSRWKVGDEVTIDDRDIVDWIYRKDGVVQGGFTLRVMLDAMPAEEADSYRRAYGW